jgi:predicted DNA-binding transcriptional regulator AlpA
MTDPKPTPPRGLDTTQLCARLGGNKPLDRSTLWRRIQRDPDFPKPFYLWDGAPRFIEAEVDAYIARRIAERDDPVRAAARLEYQQRRGQRLKAARAGDAAIKKLKRIRGDRIKRRNAIPGNPRHVDKHRERQPCPDGHPRAKRRAAEDFEG